MQGDSTVSKEYVQVLSVKKSVRFWRELLPTIRHPASMFQQRRCEQWLRKMVGMLDEESFTLFYGYAILLFLCSCHDRGVTKPSVMAKQDDFKDEEEGTQDKIDPQSDRSLGRQRIAAAGVTPDGFHSLHDKVVVLAAYSTCEDSGWRNVPVLSVDAGTDTESMQRVDAAERIVIACLPLPFNTRDGIEVNSWPVHRARNL